MIIENNPKELETMKEFHQGKRIEKKIIALAKKRVVIMATVKSVWQFTELIRNMFPIV